MTNLRTPYSPPPSKIGGLGGYGGQPNKIWASSREKSAPQRPPVAPKRGSFWVLGLIFGQSTCLLWLFFTPFDPVKRTTERYQYNRGVREIRASEALR